MNPIRRELLNGLLVLVVASLLSVAFSAFQVSFNAQLWVLILMAIAIAVGGYVVFEFVLSSEQRETEGMKKTELRELEWLKRVGTPARLIAGREEQNLLAPFTEAIEAMSPGSDYTVFYYHSREGGGERLWSSETLDFRKGLYSLIFKRVEQGHIREYKRIICFDYDVLANDHELRSGVLRVGQGLGTIDPTVGEHCRLMMKTKGCSLFVAPAALRSIVTFFGVDKASVTAEAIELETGGRTTRGNFFFYDPPNGEIIEQLRQMERETERRMVAVHKIVFPEDVVPTAELATR